MCGIVGFTGEHQAAPILLDGLAKLEYRGYDSAGIAVRDGDADVEVIKAKRRLKVLAERPRWRNCKRNLWYRTYQMGNSWRTV